MRAVRLAPGFGVVAGADAVWLVAGEDLRYRLAVDEPAWLAAVLAPCVEGARTIDALVASAPVAHRAAAAALLTGLVEERVLVEAAAAAVHAPVSEAIAVFRQDRLDHAALLAHNRAMLAARRRWLWMTTGPAARAYVSPLFVPDAGPCAECVLVHFKRLSPVPALYDALAGAGDARLAPAEVPAPMRAIAEALVAWKLALAAAPVAVPALYALHVIEARDLTVAAQVPLVDVECAACRG